MGKPGKVKDESSELKHDADDKHEKHHGGDDKHEKHHDADDKHEKHHDGDDKHEKHHDGDDKHEKHYDGDDKPGWDEDGDAKGSDKVGDAESGAWSFGDLLNVSDFSAPGGGDFDWSGGDFDWSSAGEMGEPGFDQGGFAGSEDQYAMEGAGYDDGGYEQDDYGY